MAENIDLTKLKQDSIITISEKDANTIQAEELRWGARDGINTLHGGRFIVQGYSDGGGIIVADELGIGIPSSKHGHILYPKDLKNIRFTIE